MQFQHKIKRINLPKQKVIAQDNEKLRQIFGN